MTALQIMILVIGVVVSVLFFLFIAIVIPKAVYRFIRSPLEERISAHYRPDEIFMQDLRANSLGQESVGRLHLRGNGALVLTRQQLHFFLFMPQREVRIPLDAITAVTFTSRHLGKITSYTLLKLDFFTDGQRDSIAWYLTDPLAWKSQIEAFTTGDATS